MAIKFLSKEYEEKLGELLKAEFQKQSGLTTTFCQHIVECPEGVDKNIFYQWEKGFIKDFYICDGEIPEATFVVTGKYKIFIDLIEGRLDGKAALLTGKTQLEGNMAKALSLLGSYARIEKCQKSIETSF